MSKIYPRVKGSAPGPFFVDTRCIDCGACRWIAPEIFDRGDGASVVTRQPSDDTERLDAFLALLACPAGSIGAEGHKAPTGLYPRLLSDAVYHCGYHSDKSFGAASYLIVREGGNVMIDSPRYVKSLADAIESLGGVRYLFLTHQDDVADHAKFARRFGCERIIHQADAVGALEVVERKIAGIEPVALADDLVIIPVPGHTAGSACLLYRDTFLFTGDHLYQNRARDFPTAFVNHCWHSWEEQIASMERLARFPFSVILPGHGGGATYPPAEMKEKMRQCVDWMKRVRPK